MGRSDPRHSSVTWVDIENQAFSTHLLIHKSDLQIITGFQSFPSRQTNMPPIDNTKSRRSANKPNKKGKNRTFSTPEELQAQLEELKIKNAKEEEETSGSNDEDDEEESTSDDNDSSDASTSSDEDEEEESDSDSDELDESGDPKEKKPLKAKGVSSLIEIENPNRNPKKADPSEKVELTRREKEELERQRKRDDYNRMTADGMTEEAKADLERLAVIRARREQEAAKRKAEQEKKAAEALAKKAAARVATPGTPKK